jgi:hypothetical protein
MSIRSISTAATASVLLAIPSVASARPAEEPVVGSSPVSAPQLSAPARAGHDGGADTLAVIGIAGGTLLIGAATGFNGARLMTRRRGALA